MYAILMHELGAPEVLKYEEIPTPAPGPGQARVKIEAAGVNFIDVYYRTGQYKTQLPFIPGQEAAGVVDALGEGVTEVRVGDRVAYAPDQKSYAEFAVIPAWKLVPVPNELSSQQAAAVMLQGITAHYLATSSYPIQPGDTVLIHAAAGGVGQLFVQIAKRRGARVFGTVSTEQKAKIAREAGADEVILYSKEDFEKRVKQLTDGKGVNAVYDSVGKDTFDQSLNSIKRRGYMVLFGQSSGAVPPVDPQTLNVKGSLYLTRPTIGHFVSTREELLWRARDLFSWMTARELAVRIDRTFPLAQAAEAHRYLQSRQALGKVLLIP